MSFSRKLHRQLNKWNGTASRILLVLCVIFVMGGIFLAKTVYAAGYANTYALVVQTGDSSGDSVDAFVVEYVGTDNANITRTVYVTPHDGDYKESVLKLFYAIANNSDDDKFIKRKDIVTKLGYTAQFWENLGSEGEMRSGSSDTYFFKTPTPVKEIKSIGVVAKAGKTKLSGWDCCGISLYSVDNINGQTMAGYISNEYSIDFSGKLLAKVTYKDGAENDPIAYRFEFDKPTQKIITKSGVSVDGKLVSDKRNIYLKTDGFENEAASGSDEYIIKFDIADTYKSGIEAYVNAYNEKKTIGQMMPSEILVLNLRYRDTNGAVRQVAMPVLTSSLGYAIENGVISSDTALVDMVSQSGSLAFGANLPYFSQALNATLTFVNSDDRLKAESGFSSTDKAKATHQKNYSTIGGDTINLTGIQIYKGADSVSFELNRDAQLVVKENTTPLYYYMSDTIKGTSFTPGASTNIPFESCSEGVNYKPYDERIDRGQLYLVKVKTADDEEAATSGDISAKIRYFNTNGEEVTKAINFKNDCMDYYGYWPGKNGENTAYEYGTQASGVLYAFLEINDSVNYFSGVDFTNKSKDDAWGASNFSIYRIRSTSNVRYEWLSEADDITNCYHYRDINGKNLSIEDDDEDRLISIGEPDGNVSDNSTGNSGYIYVPAGRIKAVDFNSMKISDINLHDPDFFAHYYNMDYDYATSNLGFNLPEIEYTVDVLVDSAPYSSSRNDDCGSTNFFYFQLIFQNGTSQYVQANQQLESDGFRAGKTETFTISVNRDYGEVVALNIIPETDGKIGSPYDKLNIKQVDVTRSLGNGYNEDYIFGNIGWIGIDYYEAEATDTSHYEAEIAKQFLRSGIEIGADIMFCINTVNYGDYDEEKQTYNQFKGKLRADIHYTDEYGEKQVKEGIDVVEAMYSFDGKKPEQSFDTSTDTGYISDTSLMFRQQSTDRFIWKATGVDHIDGITLRAENTTSDAVSWHIDSVSACLITQGNINENRGRNMLKEFVLDGGSKIDVASSNNDTSYEVNMSANAEAAPLEVEFTTFEGNLMSKVSKSSMPYIISREPISQNDTVNIYAFLDEKADPLAKAFNTTCGVVYNDVYGYPRQSTCSMALTTTRDPDGIERSAFFMKGLGAKQFGSFGFVQLQARGASTCQVPIDYVLVQRVRNNVVIEAYKCLFTSGGPVDISMTGLPQRTSSIVPLRGDTEYQDITLQLGELTDTDNGLTAGKHDIAVALKYKPSIGNEDDVYQTEYVYLTDMDISAIEPYDLVTIRMNQSNVKEVVGLNVATSSYLQADVVGATVGLYKQTGKKTVEGSGQVEKKYECQKWYSFDDKQLIRNQAKDLALTSDLRDDDKTLSPVTFTFNTAKSVEGYGDEVGLKKDDHVKMEIKYYVNGNERTQVIDDITNYIVDEGNFGAGQTAVAKIMLKGVNVNSIRSIVLTPYDNDKNRIVYWGLESVNINFGDGQEETTEKNATITDRKVFKEDGSSSDNEISFAGVILTAVAYEASSESDYSMKNILGSATQSKDGTINLDYDEAGTLFAIDVRLLNAVKGYNVTFDDSSKGDLEIVSQKDNKMIMKATGIKGRDVVRKITISSVENPKCYIVFMVNIDGDGVANSVSDNSIDN